jgi:hypothetical protein
MHVISFHTCKQSGMTKMGKGCILWAVGVPIPVIILLYLFHVL